jgi:uncharacterized protein YggE
MASGTGVVTADADIAVVRFSGKAYGPDAKSASFSAEQTEAAVAKALAELNIPKSAIENTSQVLERTQSFELQQYQMGTEERARRQFSIMQTWIVRVKPDQGEAVVKAAIEAGAGESAYVQWIVENPAALQAKASALAYTNARSIAEQIAQKSGVHLGHLIGVNEMQNQINYSPYGAGAAAYGTGDTLITIPSSGNGMQAITVNTSRIEIRASTTATFAIEDEAKPAR